MTDERIEGGVNRGMGKAQGAIGDLLGDDSTALKGKVKEAVGVAQDAYGQAQQQVQQAAAQAKAFVEDKPYAALGVVAGAAFLFGMIIGGGHRKVVYVTRA